MVDFVRNDDASGSAAVELARPHFEKFMQTYFPEHVGQYQLVHTSMVFAIGCQLGIPSDVLGRDSNYSSAAFDLRVLRQHYPDPEDIA